MDRNIKLIKSTFKSNLSSARSDNNKEARMQALSDTLTPSQLHALESKQFNTVKEVVMITPIDKEKEQSRNNMVEFQDKSLLHQKKRSMNSRSQDRISFEKNSRNSYKIAHDEQHSKTVADHLLNAHTHKNQHTLLKLVGNDATGEAINHMLYVGAVGASELQTPHQSQSNNSKIQGGGGALVPSN